VLISITGGKDLTLYEVDEAATRIREEVDPDANIIVGATFDESLDGIIRVSVVATGVDVVEGDAAQGGTPQGRAPAQSMPAPRTPSQPAANGPRSEPHHESRIAELAQRLKADNARIADRIERAGQPASRPGAATPSQPGLRPSVDQAATAAVAAALSDGDGVSIRPMAAKPGFVEAPGNQPAPAVAAAVPKAFIPPQPERPMSRTAPRMPTFEELPLPGQAEYRARHGGASDTEHPEKRRMTLLQRLAAVGLGRREDEIDGRADGRPADLGLRGPAGRTEPRGPDSIKQAPPLDMRGRTLPLPSQPDDDQLDIPAFLRRQANM
jgi:cell division protein FtsZ